MDRNEILSYLGQLASELERRGVRGQLFVVGGAAMAVAYDIRRVTRDIDGTFAPRAAVYEAARVVARRRRLPGDWLNDAVETYLVGRDAQARVFLDLPGLSLQVASPRYMFALKARAARADRNDHADLIALYPLTGYGSRAEALEAVSATYPDGVLPARVRQFLEDSLADAR